MRGKGVVFSKIFVLRSKGNELVPSPLINVLEKRRGCLVSAGRLWCRESPEVRLSLDLAMRRLENSLCQTSSKWVSFPNQERIMQRKERDGLRLSSAVPKIQ